MERKSQTAVVSFSTDLETLNYLELYCLENRISRSKAISYHLRMGRTYLQVLEEQKKPLEDYQEPRMTQEKILVNGVKDGEQHKQDAA